MSQTSAPLRVDVTQAQHIYGGVGHPDIYKNESTPRGIAFIVNIETFINNLLPTREGSQVDVRNLKELFTQMGYLVQEHPNLTSTELRDALNRLREDPRLAEMDSLIVMLMSHGVDGNYIVAADGRKIEEKDIFEYFTNLNCEPLKGKPKIFILQFCRGDMPDLGVEHQGDVVMEDSAVRRGPQKMPINSHMYFIYATVQGFVAYRSANKGSWLTEDLCQEFMKHAHNTDLDRLVNKLSGCVNAREDSRGRKQAVEIRRFGFDKQFYFNPLHINQLQDPQFPGLPDFLEPQPSGSRLMGSAQRGFETLAREDFQDGDALKIEVARRVRGGEIVFWFTDLKKEKCYERRYGKLTVEDNYGVFHSLSHSRGDIGQDVTLIRDLAPLSPSDGMEAFLVFEGGPDGPQVEVRARLVPLEPLTNTFLLLCTGQRGPSYKGAPVEDERGEDYGSYSCLFYVPKYVDDGREKRGPIEPLPRGGLVERDCEPGEVVLEGDWRGAFSLCKITERHSFRSIVGVVTTPSLSDLESFDFGGRQVRVKECGIRVPI